MVGRESVTNAVGFNAALFNGSRIVGPAIAGLIIGAFDISLAFLINGLSYVAVVIAYFMMRDEEMRPAPEMARPTSWREVVENLAEGARYVRHTPLVLLGVTVVGLAATVGMNFQILVPPLADSVLDVGPSGFGFLMAASGVGSTIAALSVAFTKRVGPLPIVLGAIALGIGLVILALSTSFLLSLFAMFVAGAGAIAMAVTANTTIQMAVPDQLRGRVMSVYTTVFAGSVPAGGLIMGAIASSWGVPMALGIGAVLTLAVGVSGVFWLQRIRRGESATLRVPPQKTVASASADSQLTVARRR
jgi:MFS family permease